MAIDILMPALSPTMETGTLAKWMVAVGDSVRSGDVIAEIETDKATMEVEAVDEGVLASIMVEAGAEGIAVGTPIARLAEDGESVDDVAAAPASSAPRTAAPEAPAPEAPAPEVAASEVDSLLLPRVKLTRPSAQEKPLAGSKLRIGGNISSSSSAA